MLIRFKVGNFLSFNDIQEFSMLPGNDCSKQNRLYKDTNIELLKFTAIFGANAAGKSNLVSAMVFAKNMIIKGFPESAIWKYCKLDDANREKQSYFEFEIELNGRYYAYGFELILKQQRVVSEWLYELSSEGESKEIFTRNLEKKECNIGSYFQDKKLLERLRIYADDVSEDASVLFLKNLNQNKDTLYDKFEESKIVQEVFVWFIANLDINFPDQPISDYTYFDSTENIDTICSMIKAFGTGITSYEIVEDQFEKMSSKIPERVRKNVVDKLMKNNASKIEEDIIPAIILRSRKSFYIVSIETVNDEEVIKCRTIQFHHDNTGALFDFSEESDGTCRLLDLLTILLEDRSGRVYVIDEIDRSLHPQLTYKFISEYLKVAAKKQIQLIVTTHESRLLDLDLLRRDEIWFVDKNTKGESSVYSFDEYNDMFDKKLDQAYLEGRYGAVPIFNEIFPS
mgnify:CR=1 FL=1